MLTLAATAVAGTYVWSQFERTEARAAAAPRGQVNATYPVEGWDSAVQAGIRIGPATARVLVLQIVDFQCPFCRRFAAIADSLRAEFPRDVALIVHHLPLPNHQFAQLAAVASECAEAQGAFAGMYSALYDGQDSIGVRPWAAYASRARVTDISRFDHCVSSNVTFPRIEFGKRFANQVGATGTPTVMINGWRFSRPPRLMELRASVAAVLAGKSPAEAFHLGPRVP